MPPVPRLVVITDRRATGGRGLAEVIAAALQGIRATGLPAAEVAVQLREKDLDGRALLALARPLRDLTAAAGATFVVNDRIDVALAVGADGVHLGGGSLSAVEAARLAPALAISVSTHGAADVAAQRAAAGDRLAFALFGPIHDTPSKRAYGPPLGEAALADGARAGTPLIAVGGIAATDVPALLRSGAHGVACIRAVMSARDPAAAVSSFCQSLTARP